MEASYNKNFIDDRAGGDLHKTGKYHESVTGKVIFLLKSLSQVVTPNLHIRLGTVLKLSQILPTKTQEKDSTEINSARADQDEVWESKSEQLLIKEAELVNFGTAFVGLENLMDRLKAVQSKDLETLDSIAIASDSKGKKVGKNVRCESVVCCISKYDLNME